jgi:hypothetical protein
MRNKQAIDSFSVHSYLEVCSALGCSSKCFSALLIIEVSASPDFCQEIGISRQDL